MRSGKRPPDIPPWAYRLSAAAAIIAATAALMGGFGMIVYNQQTVARAAGGGTLIGLAIVLYGLAYNLWVGGVR